MIEDLSVIELLTLSLVIILSYFIFKGNKNGENDGINDSIDSIKGEIISKLDQYKGSVDDSIKSSEESVKEIAAEALRLNDYLANPISAGKFGNDQLEVFLEKSNLSKMHWRVETAHGESRPDAEIDLPGGGSIFIDAKAMTKYWKMALDENREESIEDLLIENAKNYMDAAKDLSTKGYDDIDDVRQTGMIVMYIPLDSVLVDFMQNVDKEDFLEASKGFKKRGSKRGAPIVFTSPATLGGFLGMVTLLWKEKEISENQSELIEIIREFATSLNKTATYLIEGSKSHVEAGDNFRKGWDSLVATSDIIKNLDKIGFADDLKETTSNEFGEKKGKTDIDDEKILAWVRSNPEILEKLEGSNETD